MSLAGPSLNRELKCMYIYILYTLGQNKAIHNIFYNNSEKSQLV